MLRLPRAALLVFYLSILCIETTLSTKNYSDFNSIIAYEYAQEPLPQSDRNELPRPENQTHPTSGGFFEYDPGLNFLIDTADSDTSNNLHEEPFLFEAAKDQIERMKKKIRMLRSTKGKPSIEKSPLPPYFTFSQACEISLFFLKKVENLHQTWKLINPIHGMLNALRYSFDMFENSPKNSSSTFNSLVDAASDYYSTIDSSINVSDYRTYGAMSGPKSLIMLSIIIANHAMNYGNPDNVEAISIDSLEKHTLNQIIVHHLIQSSMNSIEGADQLNFSETVSQAFVATQCASIFISRENPKGAEIIFDLCVKALHCILAVLMNVFADRVVSHAWDSLKSSEKYSCALHSHGDLVELLLLSNQHDPNEANLPPNWASYSVKKQKFILIRDFLDRIFQTEIIEATSQCTAAISNAFGLIRLQVYNATQLNTEIDVILIKTELARQFSFCFAETQSIVYAIAIVKLIHSFAIEACNCVHEPNHLIHVQTLRCAILCLMLATLVNSQLDALESVFCDTFLAICDGKLSLNLLERMTLAGTRGLCEFCDTRSLAILSIKPDTASFLVHLKILIILSCSQSPVWNILQHSPIVILTLHFVQLLRWRSPGSHLNS